MLTKCHLLVSTNDRVSMSVDGFKIDKSDAENYLKFDKKLAFDDHISDICKKAGRNKSALLPFSYGLRVWMCCSRKNNNKISRLHEKCLQIVYNDKQFSFNELLEKDASVSIHMNNIQILATEMYKLINNLSPPTMNRVFKLNSDSRYNMRQIWQYKICILLKLKLKDGTQKIVRLVYVKFTLIE